MDKLQPQTICAQNKSYYGELYQQSSSAAFCLRGKLSFDQNSKVGSNLKFLHKCLGFCASPLSLLDYGCGWGGLLLRLPRDWRLYAYDIVPEALSNLAAVMRKMHRSLGVAQVAVDGRISLSGLDIIVCSHVLEHVEDDVVLLRQFHRALRCGGYLLLNVPINESMPDPRHIRSYTPAGLKVLLNESGFTVLAETQAGQVASWVCHLEQVSPGGKLGRRLGRVLRLLLGSLPYVASRIIEKLFLRNWKSQFYLVWAQSSFRVQL